MKLKKLIAAGIALVMVTGLAACGGNGGTGGGDSSIADIMKNAEEALEKVGSMTYDMTMDMEMAAQGQTVASSMSGKIDYITDPLKMKMDMTMDAGAQGTTAMQMYAEQSGDDYVMYMSMDGTNWMKQTLEDAEALEQYNAEASMDMYLESANSFKEDGEEAINGMDAVKYTGVIAEDTMNDVMESSGVVDQLTAMGISEEQAQSMYKDAGQLPISIWIAKDSGLPVKYEMDMTDFMQGLMDNIMKSLSDQSGQDAQSEDAAITVSKMVISMTVSDFDSVEDFEIPEAAKSAVETTF